MVAVLSGLDVLASRLSSLLRGRTVGLLSHQASVTRDLTHARQAIGAIRGVKLLRLFAPEHGLSGAAQDLVSVGAERDALTGLPVVSLYGKRLAPEPRALAGLGALVVDLQDVGARYYTFVWTMALTMRAAARVGLPVVVLDRPNPLGGEKLEGNMPDPRFASFVGLHPLPTRHGMTIGELAGYLNDTHGLGCDLTVVPMLGWRRAMLWEDTGLPWVAPSPNMPTPDTALVYPGMCLLEGTNLSEGRGTTRPFELWGAPWLDGGRLAEALAAEKLPGARFRACAFTPTWDKHRGARCHGVQVHVSDARALQPVRLGAACIVHARAQDPAQFRWRTERYEFVENLPAIDLLTGSAEFRTGVTAGRSVGELCAAWDQERDAFARRRAPFLLY